METNPSLRSSLRWLVVERNAHGIADIVHGGARHTAGASRTGLQNIPSEARIVLVFLAPLLHGVEEFDDRVGHPTFALNAADAGRPTAVIYFRKRRFVAEYFVQVAHGAEVGIA